MSHPLPQAVRDTRSSLDGIWRVQLEAGGKRREIRVPFPFEAPTFDVGALAAGSEHELVVEVNDVELRRRRARRRPASYHRVPRLPFEEIRVVNERFRNA